MAQDFKALDFTPKNISSGVRNWVCSLPTMRTASIELPYLADENTVWNISIKGDVELGTKEFTTQTITPKEYKKFREFMTVWCSDLGAKLLFELE